MIHKIKKDNIFNFLKSESIVKLINDDFILIEESKNEVFTGCLCNVKIENLNATSNYWQLNPETLSFLELNGKKVDGVIIEEKQNGTLNISLIELKSKTVTPSDIIEKFEKTLSCVYLLLNLLNGKEDTRIRVFGILIAQKNKTWNEKEDLNILSSTSIRYIKRAFHTTNTSDVFQYNDLVNLTVNT